MAAISACADLPDAALWASPSGRCGSPDPPAQRDHGGDSARLDMVGATPMRAVTVSYVPMTDPPSPSTPADLVLPAAAASSRPAISPGTAPSETTPQPLMTDSPVLAASSPAGSPDQTFATALLPWADAVPVWRPRFSPEWRRPSATHRAIAAGGGGTRQAHPVTGAGGGGPRRR